jgi:hypothetical protein
MQTEKAIHIEETDASVIKDEISVSPFISNAPPIPEKKTLLFGRFSGLALLSIR